MYALTNLRLRPRQGLVLLIAAAIAVGMFALRVPALVRPRAVVLRHVAGVAGVTTAARTGRWRRASGRARLGTYSGLYRATDRNYPLRPSADQACS